MGVHGNNAGGSAATIIIVVMITILSAPLALSVVLVVMIPVLPTALLAVIAIPTGGGVPKREFGSLGPTALGRLLPLTALTTLSSLASLATLTMSSSSWIHETLGIAPKGGIGTI